MGMTKNVYSSLFEGPRLGSLRSEPRSRKEPGRWDARTDRDACCARAAALALSLRRKLGAMNLERSAFYDGA